MYSLFISFFSFFFIHLLWLKILLKNFSYFPRARQIVSSGYSLCFYQWHFSRYCHHFFFFHVYFGVLVVRLYEGNYTRSVRVFCVILFFSLFSPFLHSVLLCNNVAINFQGKLRICFFFLFIVQFFVNQKWLMKRSLDCGLYERREKLVAVKFSSSKRCERPFACASKLSEKLIYKFFGNFVFRQGNSMTAVALKILK